MDKRLELTERQRMLLNNVQKALGELGKEDVRIIWDGVESYHVINTNNVSEVLFPEDSGEYCTDVKLEEVPCFSFGSLDLCYTDNSFCVTFK